MSLPNHDWVQQIHGTVICRRCGVFNTSMAPLYCDFPAAEPTDIKSLVDQLTAARAEVERLREAISRIDKLAWVPSMEAVRHIREITTEMVKS